MSRAISIFCAVLVAAALAATVADARVGGGFSMGSRGARTYAAPSATPTAPTGGSTIQRSVTPNAPGSNTYGPGTGGWFGRPGGLFGGGLFGGLAAGFIGAGLFGMLFGHGFFGGMGGFASLLGLLLQVALIVFVGRMVWAWFQRRNQPAYAGAGGPSPMSRDMFGGGGTAGASGAPHSAQRADEVGITAADYDEFERVLGQIQSAYSDEDIGALRALVTPEMVSYFSEDLASNASRGAVNRISDVKLLQGDLSEAWREGSAEYATVAMRFSLVDQMIDRASGRVVEGSATPQEVTEVWTFRRGPSGHWMLAAIQQA